jgi:hypothetical protein
MFPRSFWDEDPRFLDTFTAADREETRTLFGESSFRSSTQYVCVFRSEVQGKQSSALLIRRTFRANSAIRATEIVEALIARTQSEDVADAFAWFKNALSAQQAQEHMQIIRNRATVVYGGTTSQGSVPIPARAARAFNNEVAYMMMRAMNLAFDICLTGLRTARATHLNSREGVIRGQDPANRERWTARLDDGTCISVKAANFVYLRRGDYTRVSP